MIIILTPQLSLSTSLSMHACPQKHILSYTIGVKQNICKDGEWVDAPSVVVERARISIGHAIPTWGPTCAVEPAHEELRHVVDAADVHGHGSRIASTNFAIAFS